MSVNTNIDFHPSDPAAKAIIVGGGIAAISSKQQEDADYLSQAGFELVQDDILTGSPEIFEVFGSVKKTYIVREQPNNAYVDKLTIDIPAKFYIEATLKYQTWVDKALLQAEKVRLAQLLTDFLTGTMDEPEKFAADNNVDFNSFAAEPYFAFRQSSKPPVLLDDYEQEVIAGMVASERFSLEYRGEQIVLGEINTGDEGFDADDPDALQNHLAVEYEELGCSEYPMEVTEHEIKEIIRYSEFKTIIAWKWIKIGCCKTKLYYPKVLARAASKVVCVEVVSPDSLDDGLRYILRECGEKAAKTSLAVAFVAWVTDDSLDKALIAFKSVFIECVEDKFGKFVNCIVPVIVVKKRVLNDWRDAF